MGMNGPQPTSYEEILSWLTVSGEPLCSQQVAILGAMDSAYIETLYAIRAEQDREREAREKAKEEALKRAGR